MASIENAQNSACENISLAIKALETIPGTVHGRDNAIMTLTQISNTVRDIKVGGYRALKRQKQPTATVFDQPVNNSIGYLSGPGILDVPYDLQNILTSQHNTASPNISIVDAVGDSKRYLRDAFWDLRRMQSPGLRFLLSPWPIVILLITAVIYAIGYFVFHGSNVAEPLTSDGAAKVIESAKSGVSDLRESIDQSRDMVDAASKFLTKLTELISKAPPLLAALSAVYVAGRKMLTK